MPRWESNTGKFREKFKQAKRIRDGEEEVTDVVEKPHDIIDYEKRGMEIYVELALLSATEMATFLEVPQAGH